MHAYLYMKAKYPPRNGRKGLAMMAGLAGIVFGSISADAQTTYNWTATGAGTYAWSSTVPWSPSASPANGSSIVFNLTSGTNTTLNVETDRTVNLMTKTAGSQRWDIVNNGASPATLTATSLVGSAANFIFRNGSGGLSVTTQSLTVTSNQTFFGSTSDSAANQFRGLTVTGTTTVNGTGSLLMNIVNGSGNSYSLGLLDVSGSGLVTIANRPAATSVLTTTSTVSGLSGAGGTIQATATGTNAGVTANLVINNSANHSSATVLRDGIAFQPGVLTLTKAGSGTQTLSGSNTYSGGTTVTAGTLLITSTNGAGTGAVRIGEGVLQVNALSGSGAIANAITITDGDGSYILQRASGASFSAYTASSDIAGGRDTTASLLAGTASTARTLTTGFDTATSVSATNDGVRASDVFSMLGADTDIFVLQLAIATVESTQYLGWLNGSNTWVNAVAMNSATGGSAVAGYNGSYSSFVTGGGSATAAYLGSWGVDTAADTVWAILDFEKETSEFAVIPEPSTWLLLGAGLGVLVCRRRMRR